MTSLHFLERFILNEANYVIVRDQYKFFFAGGGGDLRLCDRFGHW